MMARQEDLKAEILKLVRQRGPGKTICPSEAARRYGGEDDWHPLMGPFPQAARFLASEGKIEILQKGETVDPENISGPIRLRIKAKMMKHTDGRRQDGINHTEYLA